MKRVSLQPLFLVDPTNFASYPLHRVPAVVFIISQSESSPVGSPKVIPGLLTHFMTSSIFFSAWSQTA